MQSATTTPAPTPPRARNPARNLDHFDHFDQVTDPGLYQPLPEDYVLGLTDVIGSTKAIEAGRYKAVNMAGAAAISAIRNALPGEDLAFVFGGDGASVAVPGVHADILREALARTARWVETELGLGLRVALVPLSAVRAAGQDVRVAWFQVSEHAHYAMFTGGGLAFAENAMKQGAFAVAPAPPGELPDLTGLSCRWVPAANQNGTILSLVMRPAPQASSTQFAAAVREILALCRDLERDGHPVPQSGPRTRWPPPGLDYEARALHGTGSLLLTRARLYLHCLFAWAIFYFRIKVGRFDPQRYSTITALNTDFRKFDDGLRMTLDCSLSLADRIDAALQRLRDARIVDYGTFRQAAAILTCIARSPLDDDHLHFVDGAMGGYTAAAKMLKANAAA